MNNNYTIRGTKVTSPYPVHLTPGEIRLVFSLQRIFDPTNIFVDCYFPSVRKSTDLIQIDCLAINQQGIFIFESKDYSGWIFGNGKQRYWTQTLNYGQEKYQFYNPVYQNLTHIRALQDLFSDQISVYSVIVFGRDTVLRSISDIPEYCYVCLQSQIHNVINNIKSPILLQPSEIKNLHDDIVKSRIPSNTIIRNQHISEITDRFDHSDTK